MNVLSKNYLFTFLYQFIGVTRVCCIAFANALLHALGEHGRAML